MKLGRRKKGRDGPCEFDPDEVEALTQRANDLLDELHEVMGEMSQRLQVVFGGEEDKT